MKCIDCENDIYYNATVDKYNCPHCSVVDSLTGEI